MIDINQIVIWGHKLHTHTHSYIHGGFYKAFKFLGYKVLWLDKNDNLDNINFDKSLFITEGQVEDNIPINDLSYYLLHNCSSNLSKKLKNKLVLQVLTKPAIEKYKAEKIPNDCSYFKDDCIYIIWATDLLPHEIDKEISLLNNIKSKFNINFIGMMTNIWDKFWEICFEKNIEFINYGGFTDMPMSFEENKKLIQESIIAPSLQTDWQVENEYIPCRIFKNISYGKMGITNNPAVNKLFDNKLIYSNDLRDLINKGLDFEKKVDKNIIVKDLMLMVRNNHTYLNRIKSILWAFENLL